MNRFPIWSRLKEKLPVYYQHTVRNPAWLLVFVLGRSNRIRTGIRRLFATLRSRRSPAQQGDSLLGEINVHDLVASIHEDGYGLGLKLPERAVGEILEYAYAAEFQNSLNPDVWSTYQARVTAAVEQPFIRGYYPNLPSGCPAIQSVVQDPALWQIATHYIGAEPVLLKTNLWWCFQTDQALYEQDGQAMFHYDLDDFCSLKFFFYLTDVDPSGGPHVCVRGSHRHKLLTDKLLLMVGRSDQHMIDTYGADNIVTVCGPAGTGFVEDTFCFHRGTPPRHRDRLMLSIEFGLHRGFTRR